MTEAEYEAGLFGHQVSGEVQFTAKLLQDPTAIIPEHELLALCSLCYNYVQYKKFSRLQYLGHKNRLLKHWKDSQVSVQLGLNRTDFDRLFAGLLNVTECIGQNFRLYQDNNHHHRSLSILRSEVIKHSKFSEDLIEMIFAQFYDGNYIPRPIILTNRWEATGNRLVSIRWRLDVVISDSHLAKIMEPVIRFELIYQNGSDSKHLMVKQFECRLPAFHRLRFMATNALKEVAALEARLANIC